MKGKVERVTLPSGKVVERSRSEDGHVMEAHHYGNDMKLIRDIRPDQPVREEYLCHGEFVDRATYEMLRVDYPDMPPADVDALDELGERLQRLGMSESVRRRHATLRQGWHRETRQETLPSGKEISRVFEGPHLIEETHSYGLLDVGIKIDFSSGQREETYFHKRRLVSRKTYERARQQYSDMPPSDASIEDSGGELLRLARAERQEFLKAAKRHVPNPDEGRKHDAFCIERMKAGRCADAVDWVRTKDHTLGEMTPAGSRRLVEKLMKLGAAAVHVCEIDSYEHGTENSGHLVVELPRTPAARAALLKEMDRLARAQGYQGDFDDGQRYVYVKLD